MILSNQLKEHLKGPKFSFLGTRDKEFNCDIVRAFAISDTGHDSVKFYIAEKTATQSLDNLRANKIVTLSVTHPHTSVSYQLKGKMLSIRAATREEAEEITQYIDQFEDIISSAGFPEGLVKNNFVHDPAIAIEFVVELVFDQTPKVGTGQQVSLL